MKSIVKFARRKKVVYWILQISGWTVYAIVNLFFLILADTFEERRAINIVLSAAWFLLSSHLFRNYIIHHKWFALSPGNLIWRVMSMIGLLGVSNYLFQIFLSIALGTINYETDFDTFVVITYIFAAMVFYFLWSLLYFIFHFIERYNNSLKYEALINEIKLNQLKSQLNPHFIFNALNSIRALVDEDPVKSKQAITQLSGILRGSLVGNKKVLTTLNEEIHTVKDYLALEAIRFEERLQTVFELDKSGDSFQIPPFMLQTLVENGIKHGISKLKDGGIIHIKTIVENDYLHIEIRNTGTYLNGTDQKSKGLGIENTLQRLNLLYGNRADFSICNEKEGTVLTRVVIPKS
ncbi:MAG: histidine kinase [Cyclobacteriaceae bacterium]|nr:histidine kinase [Cyclobacteriaceae bacterium]